MNYTCLCLSSRSW